MSLAIAAAVVGSQMVWALPAWAATSTEEIESFSLPTGAFVTADTGASNGTSVQLNRAGAVSKVLSFSEPVRAISLKAKSQDCQGSAALALSVDGRVLLTKTASSSWQTFSASTVIPAGSHTVKVEFTNDAYFPNQCDRNLLLDTLVFTTAEAPTAAYNHSPAAPVTGQAVSYTFAGACRLGPCNYSYANQQADGSFAQFATTANATFTYKNVGTKRVRLTVSDALQRSAQITKDIAVADSGTVLWSADLTRVGNLSQYSNVQQCTPDRVQVIDDPLVAGRKVMRFTVYNTDVAPCTPTDNPRAQTITPSIFNENGEYWVGWSVLVPNDFPKMPSSSNWLALGEVYGPPYNGHGPNTTSMMTYGANETLQWTSNDDYSSPMWTMPLVRGKWIDFVFHFKMSKDSSVGFREQWVNTGSGWVKSVFKTGATRAYLATMDETNGDKPNFHKVSLYYSKGAFPSARLLFGEGEFNHQLQHLSGAL